jgi:hypothetical protein
VKACDAEAEALSVTRMVNETDPVAVGVPLNTPELDNESPEGSEPEDTV